MNRTSSRTLAIIAASLAASAFVLQLHAAPATPAPAASPAPTKLVLVRTLNTVTENQEFQTNVQVMKNQQKALVELNAAMEKEKDPKKKQEMKTRFDRDLAKFTDDSDKMQKAYGFSLARNYTMEIVTSNIYMLVTDEEAAQFEKNQKAAAAKAESAKAEATKTKSKK